MEIDRQTNYSTSTLAGASVGRHVAELLLQSTVIVELCASLRSERFLTVDGSAKPFAERAVANGLDRD